MKFSGGGIAWPTTVQLDYTLCTSLTSRGRSLRPEWLLVSMGNVVIDRKASSETTGNLMLHPEIL